MKTIAMRLRTGFWVSFSVAALWALAGNVEAVLSTNELPQIQAIYGGTIRSINLIESATATNITRIFVSTESANSVFYADVDHASTQPFDTNTFSFHVVPDLDARANHGIVNGIAGHPESGRLFVADDTGLLSCTMASNSLVTNIHAVGSMSVNFSAVLIENSILLAIGNAAGTNMLFFGTLDESGNLISGTGSTIVIGSSGAAANSPVLLINPSNNYVYIMENEGASGIKKSSGAYNALSGTNTFTTIALPGAVSSWTGKQLGIGPDGRLFIAGASGNKMIIYSNNDGVSWETAVDTGISGNSGSNIETAETPLGGYLVYFGTAVSTNCGASGSWSSIPRDQSSPPTTHANDGVVKADPQDVRFTYMTTDQGIGTSTNACWNIFEIDRGLEAVQIQDYDMTPAKDLAWTASKSGLRHAAGSATNLQWTPDGIFPLYDGSPYYSIALDKSVTAGTTVYAGNARLYKTTDGGTNWTKIWDIDGNTNGFQSTGYFSALAAAGQTVVAGFYDPGTTRGGLLLSSDGGSNWAQVMSQVDVNDVRLMSNGVLVAVAYDSSTGTGGIFRVTTSGVTHELTGAVSIRSLAEDSSGGIYASGQDSSYALKVYYQAASDVTWTDVVTTGLPTLTQAVNGRGPALAVGLDSSSNDLPIIAVNVKLYYLVSGGTAWQTSGALTYPDGTQINVLYWDELMVGTTEGLYGQNITPGSPTNQAMNSIMTGDFDGDRKADPALYVTASGNWYVKLSGSGYGLVTLPLGNEGYQAVNGDFDGDGKADPAIYQTSTGIWKVQLSGSGYAVATMTGFGGTGYEAVAGDYDGDGKADPAIYDTTTGNWLVAMSSLGYGTASATGVGGTGYTAVQENYDSDHRFDAAIYNTANGNWTVLLSAQNYITATVWGFGGPGDAPVSGDFDGDGLADPAIYRESKGNWSVKLSGSGYATATLTGFGGTGTQVAAADYDGDGKADPIYLDNATGTWHVKLSASGYIEATLASGWTP